MTMGNVPNEPALSYQSPRRCQVAWISRRHTLPGHPDPALPVAGSEKPMHADEGGRSAAARCDAAGFKQKVDARGEVDTRRGDPRQAA
jgi:hypothetical protein